MQQWRSNEKSCDESLKKRLLFVETLGYNGMVKYDL